jgi:hypothetical protein
MDEQFALTDEQVENWRDILVTMPLPPFNMSMGIAAKFVPRQMIVDIAQRLNEIINEERPAPVKERAVRIYNKIKEEREHPVNITRTRPRNPNKRVRS